MKKWIFCASNKTKYIAKPLWCTALALLLAHCASPFVGLANTVSGAVLNQNDPETVAAGAPAYLILIDGLIEDEPDDESLLVAGAKLYSTYAAVFIDDAERARRLTAKARHYASLALCERNDSFCSENTQSFDDFANNLVSLSEDDVPAAYAHAVAWGAWIQANREDFRAVAELPKLEALLTRLVALDEAYDDGGAHLMLGIIATRLPAALGGRPEEGRAHFTRAIELSQGRNLMIKVRFAEKYARLVFDRKLHDQLLNEVLAASSEQPGLTLVNVLAKREATVLLKDADDYF